MKDKGSAYEAEELLLCSDAWLIYAIGESKEYCVKKPCWIYTVCLKTWLVYFMTSRKNDYFHFSPYDFYL